MPGAGGNELLCGPSRGSARGNGFQTTVLSAPALPRFCRDRHVANVHAKKPRLDRVQDDAGPDTGANGKVQPRTDTSTGQGSQLSEGRRAHVIINDNRDT